MCVCVCMFVCGLKYLYCGCEFVAILVAIPAWCHVAVVAVVLL